MGMKISKRLQDLFVWLKEAKAYGLYLFLLLIFWAVVPAFSKLGNFNGLQKTFWINGFAVIALLIIFAISKLVTKNKTRSSISLFSLLKISLIGILWPFAYSIFYFQSIHIGSPSLTTIIGRTSILFYAPMLVYVFKKSGSLTKRDVILMIISVFSVVVAFIGKVNTEAIYLVSVILAIGASITNGVYTAFAEIWKSKYNSLFFTLVVEFVTFFLSAIFTLITKSLVIPTGKDLFYLAFIGILSNGFAFWFFLKGFQIAAKIGASHKVMFLIVQSSVLTFAQIVLVGLLGAEAISISTIVGVFVLCLGLLWYGLSAKV